MTPTASRFFVPLLAVAAGLLPLRAQLSVHQPTFSGSAQSDLDLGGHRLVNGVVDWSLIGGVPSSLSGYGVGTVPWTMLSGTPPYLNASPARRGLAKEVWIAVRTDGQGGTGTHDDPFDGSTQAKFDGLMAGFGPCTAIHLLPGIYLTKGWNTANTSGGNGWTVKTGWKIVGSGRGVTTVRQVAPDAAPFDGYKYTVIGTAYATETDGVEVRDLTVDCNGNSLAATVGHSPLQGVQLTGSLCRISNVEVIGAWGTQAGPASECFPIAITAPDHGPVGTAVYGNIIEDSTVRANGTASGGGYVTDFIMAGQFDSTGAYTLRNYGGVIRNCRALGVTFVGYQANYTIGCLVQGNYSEGNQGYGQDSFDTVGLMLVDNTFRVTAANQKAIGLNPATAAFHDYIVARNTVLLEAANGVGLYVGGGGSGDNLQIVGNHFVQAAGTGNTAIQVNNAAFTNVWIDGNVSALPNAFPAASASVKVGNNIVSGAYAADAAALQTPSVSNVAPASGGTISLAASPVDQVVVIAPSGALASLTVAFPANASTRMGQIVRLASTVAISSISYTGALNVINPATSLANGATVSYQKITSDGVWVRIN